MGNNLGGDNKLSCLGEDAIRMAVFKYGSKVFDECIEGVKRDAEKLFSKIYDDDVVKAEWDKIFRVEEHERK